MSVPVGKRGKGQLQVLNMVSQLSAYTVKALRNDQVIPKSSRWILASKIADECLGAYRNIRKANSVKVDSGADGPEEAWKDYLRRRRHQKKAYRNLEALLGLLDITYNAYCIPDYKICEWAGLAVETEEKLLAWMQSDKRRYGSAGKMAGTGGT
jgi:hypothetical protein